MLDLEEPATTLQDTFKDAQVKEIAHNTLYINNLNEKVSLNKLKPVLNLLFSRYGNVVQITAHKNMKMKGQAFITYKDASSTERAIRKLQGRPVFKKPIKISYSQTESDEFHKLSGKMEAIEKRKVAKKLREEEKTKMVAEKASTPATPGVLTKNQIKQWKSLPPHNVLLLQNLQEEQLVMEYLEGIFGGQDGFERVRLIKFRKLAFIDFDLEAKATKSLETIDPTSIGAEVLLTYAKK